MGRSHRDCLVGFVCVCLCVFSRIVAKPDLCVYCFLALAARGCGSQEHLREVRDLTEALTKDESVLINHDLAHEPERSVSYSVPQLTPNPSFPPLCITVILVGAKSVFAAPADVPSEANHETITTPKPLQHCCALRVPVVHSPRARWDVKGRVVRQPLRVLA